MWLFNLAVFKFVADTSIPTGKEEFFGNDLEVSQQFFKTGFHVMNKK